MVRRFANGKVQINIGFVTRSENVK
jgi:hypothetical protein